MRGVAAEEPEVENTEALDDPGEEERALEDPGVEDEINEDSMLTTVEI